MPGFIKTHKVGGSAVGSFLATAVHKELKSVQHEKRGMLSGFLPSDFGHRYHNIFRKCGLASVWGNRCDGPGRVIITLLRFGPCDKNLVIAEAGEDLGGF